MTNNVITYLNENIDIIHEVVGVISSIICLVLGVKLILVRFCKYIDIKSPFRHSRYIAARRALGTAYIIIGVFSLVLVYTVDVSDMDEFEFFPLSGLIISISQIILFTVAVLALFNSKLLNRTMVAANIAPIVLLLILYVVFTGHARILFTIRFALFIYYLMQLVIYSFAFIQERHKYLLIIEDYFDEGILYDKYSCKGIAILYFCAIVIGFWALASYFFTTQLQETTFIFFYTIYYIVVAWYYLDYSKISSRIQDVTTPERWNVTEDFSREEFLKEKECINKNRNKKH